MLHRLVASSLLLLFITGCGTTQVTSDRRYSSPGGAYLHRTVAVTDGGQLKDNFVVADRGTLIVDGGEVGDDLHAIAKSTLIVKEGRIGSGLKIYQKARGFIYGGTIDGDVLSVSDNAWVQISGGVLPDTVFIGDDATLSFVLGKGTFNGTPIRGLFRPTESGHLVATFEDGSPVACTINVKGDIRRTVASSR